MKAKTSLYIFILNTMFLKKLDESVLADKIIRSGNIYYLYDWEDRKKGKLISPKHIKRVAIPILEFQMHTFRDFLKKEFPKYLKCAIFQNDLIVYLDKHEKMLYQQKVCLISVFIPLSKLESFIDKCTENGFIAKSGDKAIKEFRCMICDKKSEREYKRIYMGVPKRGFEYFII